MPIDKKNKPKDIETTAKTVEDRCKHGVAGQDCFECFGEEDRTRVAAQAPPTEPKTEQKIGPQPVELQKGMLMPRNAVELGVTLERIATGGGFPARFKTKESRLAAYNLANALMGVQWQLAVNNVANIQGQLVVFGELPGTLAERTGKVAEKHVFLIDVEYKEICTKNKNLNSEPFAGVCIIQRVGREKKEFSWTLDQARKAGQYPPMKTKWENNKPAGQIPNDDSPWNKHLGTMLMRKAMALAVKFEFPEAVVGVPIAEHDFDKAPDLEDEREVNSEVSGASILNNETQAPTAS